MDKCGKTLLIYPDDRGLVALMNNKKDWQRVLDEGWYRIPVKHAFVLDLTRLQPARVRMIL